MAAVFILLLVVVVERLWSRVRLWWPEEKTGKDDVRAPIVITPSVTCHCPSKGDGGDDRYVRHGTASGAPQSLGRPEAPRDEEPPESGKVEATPDDSPEPYYSGARGGAVGSSYAGD